MKYYIIAGEASGDLHGANLLKGLKKSDPEAQFRFWGGDKMAAVGGEENLARHYKTASFFGLIEVVRHLRTILRQIKECKEDIISYKPDAVILIDYPGFNFRIAKFAHKLGLQVYYYISPKVWAWKEKRVNRIRKYVDELFIIFPFEVEYFRNRGIDAIYEGNPLVDVVEQQRNEMPSREEFFEHNNIPTDKPIVALLSGSRKSEIKYNLPFMVELSRRFPDYQFVVGGVPWIDKEVYDTILQGSEVMLICDKTYPLLEHAVAAVITSGTATLEAALMNTPEFVCYRRDKLMMNIGRAILTIRFISLVNLIMEREVIRELIQWDMTMSKAEPELRAILPGGEKREQMLSDFKELKKLVGEPGVNDRIAAIMVETLTAALSKNIEEEETLSE